MLYYFRLRLMNAFWASNFLNIKLGIVRICLMLYPMKNKFSWPSTQWRKHLANHSLFTLDSISIVQTMVYGYLSHRHPSWQNAFLPEPHHLLGSDLLCLAWQRSDGLNLCRMKAICHYISTAISTQIMHTYHIWTIFKSIYLQNSGHSAQLFPISSKCFS